MKKKILSGHIDLNADLALLIARVTISLLMLAHGIPKFQMLLSGNTEIFPSVFGMGSSLSLGLTVFAEVVCSLLLLLGFGTRLALLPLIVTMLVAVFFIHASDEFAKKELGLLYLSAYLVLLFAGSGRYAVDHALLRDR
jgi:putative oxidoreductase